MKKNVGHEIKLLDNMITRKILSDVKEEEGYLLTPVQIRILKYLYENKDKDIYQKDVEMKISVRRSTISGILKTMEKNGIIQRIDSDMDKRVKKIVLTEKSILKIGKLEEKAAIFEKELLNGIDEKELEIFFSVIEKMKNNL